MWNPPVRVRGPRLPARVGVEPGEPVVPDNVVMGMAIQESRVAAELGVSLLESAFRAMFVSSGTGRIAMDVF